MAESVWSVLCGWVVCGAIITVLIGVGFGVLSMNPPHHTLAQACFTIAATLLCTRTAWWLMWELPANAKQAHIGLAAFIIFGIVGLLYVQSILWVHRLRPSTAHADSANKQVDRPTLLVTYSLQNLPVEVGPNSTEYVLRLRSGLNVDEGLMTHGNGDKLKPVKWPPDIKSGTGPSTDQVIRLEFANHNERTLQDVSVELKTAFYSPIKIPVVTTRKKDGTLNNELHREGTGIERGMISMRQVGPKSFEAFAAGQLMKAMPRTIVIPAIIPDSSVAINVISSDRKLVAGLTMPPSSATALVNGQPTALALIMPKVHIVNQLTELVFSPSQYPWKD